MSDAACSDLQDQETWQLGYSYRCSSMNPDNYSFDMLRPQPQDSKCPKSLDPPRVPPQQPSSLRLLLLLQSALAFEIRGLLSDGPSMGLTILKILVLVFLRGVIAYG